MASVSTAVRPGRAVRVPNALDAGVTTAADVPGIDRAVIVVRALDACPIVDSSKKCLLHVGCG